MIERAGDPQPLWEIRRLWSLWELMQRFDASKFFDTSVRLAQLSQMMLPGKWVGFPQQEYEWLSSSVADIRQQLSETGLDAAEKSAERLLEVLLRGQKGEDGNTRFSVRDTELINSFAMEIVARATDQLESRFFLYLTADEAKLWESHSPPYGEEVAGKYESLAYDMTESAKCLAADRSTAAAFHAIRCLEGGIRAISRCLAIPDPTRSADRSWFKLLKAIKEELDRRWPSAGNRSGGDGRFFEEAYAALAAMQNPWRNATMHLDQKYTEEEAKHIFEIVRGFMMKLAARCDENGDPKA